MPVVSALSLLIIGGILFAAAIGFLAAELLVPSHGILATFCVLFAVLGVVACYMAHPAIGIISGIIMLIASPFIFYGAVRIYPNTPMGRRVMLKQSAASRSTDSTGESATLAKLIGKSGIATTPLRPVGACEIDGNRIECVSESTIIEPGTPIEVTHVIGLRVIVRPSTRDRTS